ncbi:DNA topoisomerase I [Citrobacter koseri]|uniref:Omega-protein n=1 Tax=Citrobacter koseri TaxID=545 RepID=A0A447UG21_CITKO|nr:DNA topoisomerase I [Citrobacter koseri]
MITWLSPASVISVICRPVAQQLKRRADSTSTKTAKKPKKDERGALVNRMGVDPWHNWDAQYEVLPGKEKVVSELKQLAEKADHIYLATDLDREGEAIAWHLREVIGGDDTRYSRVVFNEITKNAIRQAFDKPGELNIDRVNAQQARRFMDRVVGLYGVAIAVEKNCARPVGRPRNSPLPCVWLLNANVTSKRSYRKSSGK